MSRTKCARSSGALLLVLLLAWLTPPALGAGLIWPASQLLPTFSTPAPVIEYIDLFSASPAQQALFASLQGIVNRTQPRLALVTSSTQEGEFTWLGLHNLSYSLVNGYSAILQFQSNVTGLVVTDTNQPDTLNLATTIAGVNNELICDPSLLATLTNAPYNLAVKDDLRGRFSTKYQVYQYLYTNYWPLCTHRIIAGMETNNYWNLRDYLVAVKSAVVWLDPGVSADAAVLAPFTASMTPVDGTYLGWWPNEGSDLQWIAQYGIPVIASDDFNNASLYSGVPSSISVPAIPPAPPLQNKVYVSIVLSDGDNIQYMQHKMKLLWGNSARGSVPIGWTVQPLSADFDPAMLNYYWSTATTNDCLVSGPSGAGYTRINYWNAVNTAAFTRASNPYLQRSGVRAITVWVTLSSATGAAYAANCPTLVGLFDDGDGYYATNYGALPVTGFPSSANYASTVSNLLSGITNTAASWNGSSPMFIAVQAVSWDLSPADCRTVANSLNSNEYLLVRPDHLLLLSRQAAGLGASGASPYVAAQPVSQFSTPASNVTFSVVATGTSPLNYQWRFNTTNLAGATTSACTVSNVQSSNAGNYSVVITNSYGAATSAVASLMVYSGPPQIFNGPQTPFYALLGESFSNSVAAAGALPLSYQWQFNGTNLVDGGRVSGSQGSVLATAGAQPGDAGNYQVIISNIYGSVTSSVAALTVAGALPVGFYGLGPGWTASGSAAITASNVLTLTDPSGLGGNGSFFFQYPQYISTFKAAFTYQAGGNKGADGVAFCLQNDPRGASALGGGGGALGVGGVNLIAPSAELEFNLYTGNSQNLGYTFLTNGLTGGSGDNGNYRSMGSVNLASGDPINITVNYANGQMALAFTDAVARASFTTNLTVGNLTQIVGGNSAYVGFTGAYGGVTSVQTISNFTFVSIPPASVQLNGTNVVILWPGSAAGYALQQNPDLTSPNWVNATNQYLFTNGLNQVEVPVGLSNQFYRLVLPSTP